MKYGILRTDKIKSIETRTGMVSIKVPEIVDYLENGCIATITDIATVEEQDYFENKYREIYNIVPTIPGLPITQLVLIGSPEINDFSIEHGLDSYCNKSGSITRGYKLSNGDVFSVTKELIEGDPDVGKVVATSGFTLVVTDGEMVFGKIIDKEFYNQRWFYTIEVDSNATESPSGGSSIVGSATVGTAIVGG